MITTLDIINAINDQAIEACAELEAVYIDLVPKGFRRPSLLIESLTISGTAAAYNLIREKEYFTLTIYDAVDDYNRSSAENLLVLRQKIQTVFRPGFLRVKDRAIGVEASPAGRDYDRAYIDLQFEYHDWRARREQGSLVPVETVEATINLKKE